MDIVSKINGNTCSAPEFNQIPTELETLQTSSGQTSSDAILNQVSIGVSRYAANNFYIDSGAADAYVLTLAASFTNPVSATIAYFTGMTIRFRAENAGTGGAATVNVNGAGVKSLKEANGTTNPSSIPTTEDSEFRYDGTVFRKVNLSSALSGNAIINGDFNIWQRDTSFPAIADGTFTADRWKYQKSGTMVHTVSQSTDVPTVAQAGRLFNYSLKVDCTTADNSIAAGDYCLISTPIEGYNFLPLAQKPTTFGIWVKATKLGVYGVFLVNSGQDRSFVSEITINSSNTWEYKTVSILASTSSGIWNYTNGLGINLGICLAAGSTRQTTSGSWNNGDFYTTSNQVNGCDSASNDFYICGVQLEAGSVATQFEQRSIGQELLLCQRYFEILGGQNTNEALCTGYASSTVQAQGVVKYVVQKRSAPTITFSATNLFRFNNATSNFTCSNIVANNVSDNVKTLILTLTIAGVVANTGGLIDTVSTSGRISISSEL